MPDFRAVSVNLSIIYMIILHNHTFSSIPLLRWQAPDYMLIPATAFCLFPKIKKIKRQINTCSEITADGVKPHYRQRLTAAKCYTELRPRRPASWLSLWETSMFHSWYFPVFIDFSSTQKSVISIKAEWAACWLQPTSLTASGWNQIITRFSELQGFFFFSSSYVWKSTITHEKLKIY